MTNIALKIKLYNLMSKVEDESDPILFVAIPFPEIQSMMELPEFEDNSILINTDPFISEFGYSAYLVRYTWLVRNLPKI